MFVYLHIMKQHEIFEADLIDENGEPTEEWLNFLRTWDADTGVTIQQIFTDLLTDGLWNPDWCLVIKKPYKGERKIEIHTGGMSSNEQVVDAILENFWLRHLSGYYMWKIGGHHYFKIKWNGKSKQN